MILTYQLDTRNIGRIAVLGCLDPVVDWVFRPTDVTVKVDFLNDDLHVRTDLAVKIAEQVNFQPLADDIVLDDLPEQGHVVSTQNVTEQVQAVERSLSL